MSDRYRGRADSPVRDQSDRIAQLHNRLFILGGKNATEDEFRDCFSKYGSVQDIWIVKDKRSGEPKGRYRIWPGISAPIVIQYCSEGLN